MRADDVLDQIDTCLTDHELSDDAMRWAPDQPPGHPGPPPRRGRNLLIQRIIDQRGLDPEAATAAVRALELGHDTEPARLAALEARAVMNEMGARLRETFRPMVESVSAAFKQLSESLTSIRETAGCNDCGTPARRRDRPAWQSPYGPARRRRG